MMSLFSVFDPISYLGMSLNWSIVILVYLFVNLLYYLVFSGFQSLKLYIYKQVNKVFCDVSVPNYLGLCYLSVSVFVYLVISNMMGLFPFIFTATAHPMITVGWGLVFWISFIFMGFLKNFKSSAAHLVPEGSPLFLSPLMVLIESVSHLIRPFTLSIRLAANMMAGHLILGLLSSISMLGGYGFLSSVLLQSVLLVLEFAVAVIQGFVFSILLLLYALEYY